MSSTPDTLARTAPARTVGELWYTRCPVPTASSLAIAQGWLDDEFAPDAITVASLRSSADAAIPRVALRPHPGGLVPPGREHPADWTRSRGSDLRLIGLSWADQYQAIVALPRQRDRRPEGLRGRPRGARHSA